MAGKLKVNTAAKVADLPPETRAGIVAAPNPKAAAREALAGRQRRRGTTLPAPAK